MKIAKDTVVSVAYKLSDAQGNLIEESDEPMVYLHGGYDGTFPKIEEALDGQEAGYETLIQLEPQDAFGEYDPELVKVEERSRFPEPLEVGMQFEGTPEDGDDDIDSLIYSVTDVAEDKVVLDGNHPLAVRMAIMACPGNENADTVGKPRRSRPWSPVDARGE